MIILISTDTTSILRKSCLHTGTDTNAPQVWCTTDDESLCTSAFLRIRNLAVVHPGKYLDVALKASYLAFVKCASATNEFTLRKISLLQKCVVELFCLETASAYQHAFVFIRQLAIHLRGALRARTRTSSKKVCNWQFLNCLKLWAAVLCHNSADTLQVYQCYISDCL